MKKILLALLIGGATLTSFSSCTKEYVTNYVPGVSYVYPVEPKNWTLIGNTNTYYYERPISDLDEKYFEDGHVNVAISYLNSGVYQNIPATIGNYNFRASYSIGKVIIYADEIGTNARITPPSSLDLKIVLTDAEIGN